MIGQWEALWSEALDALRAILRYYAWTEEEAGNPR